MTDILDTHCVLSFLTVALTSMHAYLSNNSTAKMAKTEHETAGRHGIIRFKRDTDADIRDHASATVKVTWWKVSKVSEITSTALLLGCLGFSLPLPLFFSSSPLLVERTCGGQHLLAARHLRCHCARVVQVCASPFARIIPSTRMTLLSSRSLTPGINPFGGD